MKTSHPVWEREAVTTPLLFCCIKSINLSTNLIIPVTSYKCNHLELEIAWSSPDSLRKCLRCSSPSSSSLSSSPILVCPILRGCHTAKCMRPELVLSTSPPCSPCGIDNPTHIIPFLTELDVKPKQQWNMWGVSMVYCRFYYLLYSIELG